MRRIIIIGTIHTLTPETELIPILENLKPDILFIEISEEDIISNNFKDYPEEMIYSFNWAKKNNIKVIGFDSKINVFAENKTEKDNEEICKK